MTSPGLFDLPAGAVVPDPTDGLSPDQRRTVARLVALSSGRHPVEGGLLHPDAPPGDDRRAPGPRCGGCVHLVRETYHRKPYQKCDLIPVTHGPGTDIRAWWPACRRWQARGEQ